MSAELDKWVESQEHQVPLDAKGKIIDYLNPDVRRENTPEERIRQKMTVALVEELGYPKAFIALERTINIGTEKKRADIVIYADELACAENNQGKILIIGEVKAPSIKAPDGQGVSYIAAATSAQGGFWTNGSTIIFYRKDPNTGNIINWLGLPKYGHGWDSIGHLKKSDLIVPVDLKIAFKRCHNAMYRTGIDSEDVALDMVRIILAKLEDESSSKDDCDFSITPDEYGDPKLKSLACGRVQALFKVVRDRFPDVFTSHEKITASDDQLAIVISQLQQYAFMDAPHDVIGTAYEVYVASHLKGERGQFFTNRLAVNMMVRMLNPTEKDVILDPSCGSGGFLITAMNYIFGKIDNSNRTPNAKEVLKRNVVHQLFGVDISPKLVKIAKANMLLGKDGHGGIERGNSLDDINKLTATFRERAGAGMVSMILTNPPFGAGYDIRIKEPNILRHFAAGRVWNVDDDGVFRYEERLNSKVGVAPELLFLERCVEWLKPGGVLGIVMAKGQLDNREALAVRNRVLSTCKLLAVVNLHEDTFEPFCGSKASVIFLKKLNNKEVVGDYPIYMAISNKIGQTSRGEPIYKRDSEGNPVIKSGCFVLDEDLSDIAEDYHKFVAGELVESEFRFSIKRSDLKSDSLSFNPIQYLPKHNAAFEHVLLLGESDDFQLHRLGDIATVFNGPRFKRPYAEIGVTSGPTIRKYFTGTALTQLNSDNIKYLDEQRASKQVLKNLEALTIYKGYILISDSGTLGRVTYALQQHDGHVATNNLIRVVIEDRYLRGYVYEFLKSETGQSLMLKNAYGTNQEHLEPDVIAEIPIPIPRDEKLIKKIGKSVLESIESLELSIASNLTAERTLAELLGVNQ
ncbi:N-6 DNA methylase [Geomonas agri]|uniref:N-6 DNA methylase n=1 Tax=Geomonas agri TaxID=2873702 RepID=UPI001CD3FEFF|nr:N-6 DNA methylase [Geomonas agri]